MHVQCDCDGGTYVRIAVTLCFSCRNYLSSTNVCALTLKHSFCKTCTIISLTVPQMTISVRIALLYVKSLSDKAFILNYIRSHRLDCIP